eukprot:scaffold8177_cov106-Cylindrotheca_fusiformis.AAC.2
MSRVKKSNSKENGTLCRPNLDDVDLVQFALGATVEPIVEKWYRSMNFRATASFPTFSSYTESGILPSILSLDDGMIARRNGLVRIIILVEDADLRKNKVVFIQDDGGARDSVVAVEQTTCTCVRIDTCLFRGFHQVDGMAHPMISSIFCIMDTGEKIQADWLTVLYSCG